MFANEKKIAKVRNYNITFFIIEFNLLFLNYGNEYCLNTI